MQFSKLPGDQLQLSDYKTPYLWKKNTSICMHTQHIMGKFPNEYVMKTRIETFFITTHPRSIETLECLYSSDIS